MKLIFSLFLFISGTFLQQSEISQIRSLYQAAALEERAAEKLLEITEGKMNDPLLRGYHAVAQMMMAKHVGNPFKKMSYFRKGKELFSEAIAADPKNPELRLLRFAVQTEIPGFLNYKSDLQEDKSLLLSRVSELDDAQLRQMILECLRSSEELTASEKENL